MATCTADAVQMPISAWGREFRDADAFAFTYKKRKIQTRPKTHGMCDYRQYDSRKYTPLKEYNEVVFIRNIRPASACSTTKTFSSMDDG